MNGKKIEHELLSDKKQMAITYCQGVKEDSILRIKRMYSMQIEDDNSPLSEISNKPYSCQWRSSSEVEEKLYVREIIVEKLNRINKLLMRQNKTLVILSGWRSYGQQKVFRQNQNDYLQSIYPNKTKIKIDTVISHFIAPESHSMHSTGGAVDALIYDNESNLVLDFGSNNGYSIDLNVECYSVHPGISIEAQKNRKLLFELFEDEGFVVDPKAFWHFDYGNVAWAVSKNQGTAVFGPIFI
ncbi:D-alanyl-D-alanine carboxypeptidase family protein [Crocinitomicaceae bacterium]|nr:D-alanyl-D-alanine carboxypeptidase family protein [Crocinitomicaceae bacterium]